MGIDIYDIHRYFYELTVGQQTPGFWGVTNLLGGLEFVWKEIVCF